MKIDYKKGLIVLFATTTVLSTALAINVLNDNSIRPTKKILEYNTNSYVEILDNIEVYDSKKNKKYNAFLENFNDGSYKIYIPYITLDENGNVIVKYRVTSSHEVEVKENTMKLVP